MIRIVGYLLVLFLLMAVFGRSALADESAATWPKDKPVVIGTITHNPPYVLQNPSGGIDLDLIEAAFGHVGLKVEFTHAPLSRVQILLETNKVDAMTTFRTIEGLCVNSDVFSYWHDGISVPKQLEKEVATVQDLAGLRVGMFPGAVMVLPNLTEQDVSSFGSSVTVFNRGQLIKMLHYGRLDAYIGDYWALEYAYRQLTPDQPKPYRVAVEFEPTPRRLCIKNSALVEPFNRGVKDILAEGLPEKVKARYLGEDALALMQSEAKQ